MSVPFETFCHQNNGRSPKQPQTATSCIYLTLTLVLVPKNIPAEEKSQEGVS